MNNIPIISQDEYRAMAEREILARKQIEDFLAITQPDYKKTVNCPVNVLCYPSSPEVQATRKAAVLATPPKGNVPEKSKDNDDVDVQRFSIIEF